MIRRRRRKPTKTLWIFCEGKTEKLYFKKLKFEERINRLKIKSIESSHKNADGIIQEVLDFVRKSRDFQEGDLLAAVFDRDANTNEQLRKTKSIAKNKGIVLSFSNPCFEYWILCHYGFFPNQYGKTELINKIKEFISDYRKNDPGLYSKTKSRLSNASDNAKGIEDKHRREQVTLISRESNPITLVFKLIKKIDNFRS